MKTAPDKWGTVIERDLSGVEELRKTRGVKTFADFPERTQEIYLQVAKCFPGWQVWACGSRVVGHYVDKRDGEEIRRARIDAGIKDKIESDFDFLVEPNANQSGKLPDGAERVRCKIPSNEKIKVPIYLGN